MLKIPFTSTEFPPIYNLTNSETCSFSWAQLIHAAITVGKAEHSHLLRYGVYSRFEIIFRTSLIYANLKENDSGYITQTDVNRYLDPTEKGAFSYTLGLVIAKLLAEKYLDVPWLMHLDVYRDVLAPTWGNSRERPDLVGRRTTKEWVVIEAKGRTGTLNKGLLESAKSQTQNLKSVNGVDISLRVASGAFFRQGKLELAWTDPPNSHSSAPDLNISPERYLFDYYEPFMWLLERQEVSDVIELFDNSYQIVNLPEADLTIGIDARILDARMPTESDKPIQTLKDLPPFTKHVGESGMASENSKEDSIFVGSDGILVQTGDLWRQSAMSREPRERRK
jgi:hypothetical protein